MEISELNNPDDHSTSPEETTVYVGPRPYQLGQELYGRDREAVELCRLLISQRLVLLHSPSGAGKTSLIQAKLVPALKKRRFEIPFNASSGTAEPQPITVRVNREPEASDPPGVNRYKLSALLSLELQRPEAGRRRVQELAGFTLDDYLEESFPAASRDVDPSKPEEESFRPLLLLFDQFEELVTMDPTDEEKKLDFVRELGKALLNKGRWALFAIREDFLGALEPFLGAIPTGLSATYRLDLLRAETAPAVIEEPARSVNVTYEEGVVHEIVEDLRRIQVQGVDGSMHFKDGIYVEPVQLQVVCQSLWRIRDGSPVITREHLKQLGQGRGTGVDAVLAGYYADRVAEAAYEDNVSERLVRNWFSKRLIGSQRVRRPVLVEEALSFGLSMACLQILDKAFLIRREIRSGATWYELAHDRLMSPVLEDNELWRQQNLTTFQSQAELWEDRSRPEALLLAGESLEEAEREAERLKAELTAYEKEFLEASQKARAHQLAEQAREQELSRVRLLRKAVAGGALLLVVVSTLAAIAFWERHVADVQREIADEQKEQSQWLAYAGFTSLAQEHLDWEDSILAREALDQTRADFRGWEYQFLDSRIKKHKNTFPGHKDTVISFGVIADKNQLVTAARDRELIVWDLSNRTIINKTEQQAHDGLMNCMVMTPDGRQIITGGADHTLRVWDTELNKSTTLGSHETAVTSLAIEPHGRWIASGAQDGSLILWDLKTNESQKIADAHEAAILCIAVSHDGLQFVTGDADGQLKMWDSAGHPFRIRTPEGDEVVLTFAKHSGAVTCVDISPEKNWLMSGSDDRKYLFWYLPVGKDQLIFTEFEVGDSPLSSLDINQAGTKIVTGSRDGVLTEWNLKLTLADADQAAPLSESNLDRSAEVPRPAWQALSELDKMILDPAMSFQAHSGIITRVAYVEHQGEDKILSSSADNAVKMWDGKPRHYAPELVGHTGPVFDFSFFPDGKRIISASGDRTLRIVQIENNQTEVILKGHEDAVWCVAVSPDGKRVVSGSADHTIRLWDAETGKELETLTGHTNTVARLLFVPESGGLSLISCSQDGTLKMWDLNSHEEVRTFKGHKGGVTDLAITKDGKLLVSSSSDKTVRIWNVATGKEVMPPLMGHTDEIWSVAISPDGKQIASGSDDETIRIWDLQTAELLHELRGHTAGVESLTYNSDGSRLLSGSLDNTVRLWELSAGEDVLTLWDHSDSVWRAKFSPDEKRIVSCSEDWTLNVFDSTPDTGFEK